MDWRRGQEANLLVDHSGGVTREEAAPKGINLEIWDAHVSVWVVRRNA